MGNAEAARVLLGHLQAHRHFGFLSRDGRKETATRTLNLHSEARRWMARGAELDRHQLVAYAFDALQDKPI